MSEEETSRISPRLWLMLFCGTMIYLFVNFQRTAIPGPIFNLLQKEFSSPTAVTSLGAFFMYPYALTQLCAGIFVDRYGGKAVMRVGALLLCLGSLAFPLCPSLNMLYLCRIVSGIGAGTIYLGLIKEAMRFPKKIYGLLISLIILIGFVGGILANAPFTASAEAFGFRKVLLYTGISFLFVYVIWNFSYAGLPKTEKVSTPFTLAPFRDVAIRKENWALILFNSLNFSMFYSLQTVIGKKFTEDYCGLSSTQAAMIFTATGASCAIGGMLLTWLSHCLDNRHEIVCRLCTCLTFANYLMITILICFNIRTPWLILGFGIQSLSATTMVLTVPLLRKLNSDANTGVAVSIVNFFNYFFVASFGNLSGLLIGLFPAVEQNGMKIYGQNSYLVLFATLATVGLLNLFFAFHIRNPKE